MSEVVLVRHAETEWSASGRHTGRTDVPLTDAGRRAAADLRERLAGRDFRLVLSSPLSRAADTARLAGLEAEHDADLLEWDYGDYEGRKTPEIRAERPGWLLWRDGVPNGEDGAAVAARADRVIARVLEALGGGGADAEGDACLVAHGHVLRILGARWMQQPPGLGGRLWLHTGALCVLGWERELRVVRRWNL